MSRPAAAACCQAGLAALLMAGGVAVAWGSAAPDADFSEAARVVQGDTGVDLQAWRRGLVYGGLGLAGLTAVGLFGTAKRSRCLLLCYLWLGGACVVAGAALAAASAALATTVGSMEVQVDRWCARFEEVQAELSVRDHRRLRANGTASALPIGANSTAPALPTAQKFEPNGTAPPTPPPGQGGVVEGIFKIGVDFNTIRSDVDGFARLFQESVTAALGCPRSRLHVVNVREGSIIVSFQLRPGPGEDGIRLVERWHAQLLDVNSTLLRDDAFGGFAERGILVLVPLGDQFEHAPLSAGELAELRAMGGIEFLDRACVLRAPSERPLAQLKTFFTAAGAGLAAASAVLALTLFLALAQPKAENTHGFVEVEAESTSSAASDD